MGEQLSRRAAFLGRSVCLSRQVPLYLVSLPADAINTLWTLSYQGNNNKNVILMGRYAILGCYGKHRCSQYVMFCSVGILSLQSGVRLKSIKWSPIDVFLLLPVLINDVSLSSPPIARSRSALPSQSHRFYLHNGIPLFLLSPLWARSLPQAGVNVHTGE